MARASVRLPGTFGDVTPALSATSGGAEWFAVTSGAEGTQCFRGSGVIVSPNLWNHPTPLHFVRCAAGTGSIVAAGQRADGELEVVLNGQPSHHLSGGLAFGQNPVDVHWIREDEFVLVVMRSNVTVEKIAFDARRPHLAARSAHDVRPLINQEGTSQGVLEIDPRSGDIVFTDVRRAVQLPDARVGFVPNSAGSWVAAQAPDDRLLVTDGVVVESVFIGATYEPRLIQVSDGTYVAACRAADAVVVVPALRSLAADTEPAQPPSTPPVSPPMPDTSRVRAILDATWNAAGRPDLGASSTREQRNAFFLSFCAVMHHGHPTLNPAGDTRWGAKRADSGRPQSDDVLAWRVGPDDPAREEFVVDIMGWDLIPGAGANGWHFSDPGHGEEMHGQMWIRPPRAALPASGPAAPSAPPPDVPDAAEVTRAAADLDRRFAHLRTGSQDDQREWIGRVAYLLNRRRGSAEFGRKRAGDGRPISRNVLARRMNDGQFLAVSLINEATSALEHVRIGVLGPPQTWLAPPDFADMDALVSAAPPVEPSRPTVIPTPDDAISRAIAPLQEQIDDLRALVGGLKQSLDELRARVGP